MEDATTPGEAVAKWEAIMEEQAEDWNEEAYQVWLKENREFVEEVRFGTRTCEPKHWGVWHPERGWSWAYGIVFSTTHRVVAEAQCDVNRRNGFKDSDLYEVRCIEEWADERPD